MKFRIGSSLCQISMRSGKHGPRVSDVIEDWLRLAPRGGRLRNSGEYDCGETNLPNSLGPGHGAIIASLTRDCKNVSLRTARVLRIAN